MSNQRRASFREKRGKEKDTGRKARGSLKGYGDGERNQLVRSGGAVFAENVGSW